MGSPKCRRLASISLGKLVSLVMGTAIVTNAPALCPTQILNWDHAKRVAFCLRYRIAERASCTARANAGYTGIKIADLSG